MKKGVVVMGFGTFDGLHPGHLFYLSELKKLGDELIIVIARDRSVKRIKGKSPFFGENSRLEAVKELDLATEVVLGSETDFYEVVRSFNPDILGFGYDQRVNEDEIRKSFPNLQMKRIEGHHPEKYKSSLIKREQEDG